MILTVLNVGQNYRVVGGSDRYQLSLETLLQRRGHHVVPFAAQHPQNLPTSWSAYFPPRVNFEHPALIDVARYVYSRPAQKSIEHLLRELVPDIAHLHIYYGQLTSSILRPLKRHAVPLVQTLHEYKTVCPVYTLYSNGRLCQACRGRHFWHAVTKRCNRGSVSRSLLSATEAYVSRWFGGVDEVDHFIAVSDFVRDKVIELGLPESRVTTISNFVDTSDIDPAQDTGEYFLYFGRLEWNKGLSVLIDAAGEIKNVPLLIVGDGGARTAIARRLLDEDLSHIRLLGFKSKAELGPLIRNAICTIAPSLWYETFGLTLLESFAHGRPVIASDIGGMTEVVTDGVDGFLVPPGDVSVLRERMEWMASNASAAVAMGRYGRTKAEGRFGPDLHYDRLMSLYGHVLGRRQ